MTDDPVTALQCRSTRGICTSGNLYCATISKERVLGVWKRDLPASRRIYASGVNIPSSTTRRVGVGLELSAVDSKRNSPPIHSKIPIKLGSAILEASLNLGARVSRRHLPNPLPPRVPIGIMYSSETLGRTHHFSPIHPRRTRHSRASCPACTRFPLPRGAGLRVTLLLQGMGLN